MIEKLTGHLHMGVYRNGSVAFEEVYIELDQKSAEPYLYADICICSGNHITVTAPNGQVLYSGIVLINLDSYTPTEDGDCVRGVPSDIQVYDWYNWASLEFHTTIVREIDRIDRKNEIAMIGKITIEDSQYVLVSEETQHILAPESRISIRCPSGKACRLGYFSELSEIDLSVVVEYGLTVELLNSTTI